MEPKNLLNKVFLNLIEGNTDDASEVFSQYFRAKTRPMLGEAYDDYDDSDNGYDPADDYEKYNDVEDYDDVLTFKVGNDTVSVRARGKQKVHAYHDEGDRHQPPYSEVTDYGPITDMSLPSFKVNDSTTTAFDGEFDGTESDILISGAEEIAAQLQQSAQWYIEKEGGELEGDTMKFTDPQFCLAFMQGLAAELKKITE